MRRAHADDARRSAFHRHGDEPPRRRCRCRHRARRPRRCARARRCRRRSRCPEAAPSSTCAAAAGTCARSSGSRTARSSRFAWTRPRCWRRPGARDERPAGNAARARGRAASVLAWQRHAEAKSTFVVNNLDAAGTGFNDPTPATPVGGNPGTTVGAQRLAAFREAANIWAAALDSRVPVVIDAHFGPLACTAGRNPAGRGGRDRAGGGPTWPSTRRLHSDAARRSPRRGGSVSRRGRHRSHLQRQPAPVQQHRAGLVLRVRRQADGQTTSI